MNSISPAGKRSFLIIALLLVYWLTRVIVIDNLALFLDEANHLWWARFVWDLQPFLAASDGRLLNVLWIAVFWPFNASVWISRISVVLIAIVGLACLIAFAQRTHSTRAAVIAALLYTALPLTFFFERMALADSLSAPFVAGALWAVSRCFQPRSLEPIPFRQSLIWAALVGVAITAAILVKISNLIFLCLPFFAGLFLFKLKNWRKAGLVTAAMYGVCFVTLLPSAWLINKLGQSDLGLDLVTLKTSIPLTQLPGQIQSASLVVLKDASFYLPFPIWLVVLAGILLAAIQRRRAEWFLLAVLAATVGALVGRSSPAYLESRFLPVYAPLLAILTGTGLATLAKRWYPAVLSVVIILLLPGLAFMRTGWTQPEDLPLPSDDRWQYITGWPSGYGFREIADNTIHHDSPLQLVTLDLGGWQRLLGYLLGRTTAITPAIYRPDMTWDENIWLLLDRPKDDADIANLNLNLVELARYPRPGNESAIVIYRVEP